MSMLKLKTKSDIKDFFRILAEESVNSARQSVYDPDAERLGMQRDRDNDAYKTFTSIKEQGAPVQGQEPAQGEDIETSVDVDVQEEPVIGAEDAAAEEFVSDLAVPEKAIEQVNFSSLTSAIKQMRSGLSVDDTAVQNPLRSYFDFLSEPERKALYAFLDALAGIMTQRSTAETAPDPSDPPYFVSMCSSGSSEDVEVEEVEVAEEAPQGADLPPPPAPQQQQDIEVEEEEEEEVSTGGPVPIAVGQPQEREAIAEIREKVLNLLGRS